MLRIELRNRIDPVARDQILGLVSEARRLDGHDPVGEHKLSHLRLGAKGWVGVLAFDDDRLVGYAHLRWNAPSARPRVAVEVVVHPGWYDRDVAPRLVNETRAVLGRAGGGPLFLWVHRVEDPADTLAARMGFRVQRELAYMARDLTARPLPPPLPYAVEVLPFRPGRDDEALLAVNNAAFRGHPENGGWGREDLDERMSLGWFDAEGLLMAWRGSELLGFHWTKWHAHDSDDTPAHAPLGEVYVLAVSPVAQGLGLGRALLDAGLAHLWDRACRRAVLYVDEANEGARKLYDSEGFATLYREVCYEEEVWPILDHRTAELLRPA